MTTYPLPKFSFQVEWGSTQLAFSEVTGLDTELEFIEYQSGNVPEGFKLRLPGMQKFNTVMFKRGTFIGGSGYKEWLNSAINSATKKDITLSLLDEKHKPIMAWKIINAFPVKVVATEINANSNEIAFEHIEIAHEGIEIKTK